MGFAWNAIHVSLHRFQYGQLLTRPGQVRLHYPSLTPCKEQAQTRHIDELQIVHMQAFDETIQEAIQHTGHKPNPRRECGTVLEPEAILALLLTNKDPSRFHQDIADFVMFLRHYDSNDVPLHLVLRRVNSAGPHLSCPSRKSTLLPRRSTQRFTSIIPFLAPS